MDNKQVMEPTFPNRRAVFLSIKETGYQISSAHFYRACGKPGKNGGQIRVNADGSVNETEVREYCKTLKRVEGDIDDLKNIIELKSKREVEKLEEQIAKLRFDRFKEEGKFLDKKNFESELAARAVIFETGLKHLFNTRVGGWIALVGGRPEKAPDLLQVFHNALEAELSNYATTRTYQVIFEEEK